MGDIFINDGHGGLGELVLNPLSSTPAWILPDATGTISLGGITDGSQDNATLRWDQASGAYVENDNFTVTSGGDLYTLGGAEFNGDVSMDANLTVSGSTTFYGDLLPHDDNTKNVGSSNQRWNKVFVGDNGIDITNSGSSDEWQINQATSTTLDFNTGGSSMLSLDNSGTLVAQGNITGQTLYANNGIVSDNDITITDVNNGNATMFSATLTGDVTAYNSLNLTNPVSSTTMFTADTSGNVTALGTISAASFSSLLPSDGTIIAGSTTTPWKQLVLSGTGLDIYGQVTDDVPYPGVADWSIAAGQSGIGNLDFTLNGTLTTTIASGGTLTTSGDLYAQTLYGMNTTLGNSYSAGYIYLSDANNNYGLLQLNGGNALTAYQTYDLPDASGMISLGGIQNGTTQDATLRWDSNANAYKENTNFTVDAGGNVQVAGNLGVNNILSVGGGFNVSVITDTVAAHATTLPYGRGFYIIPEDNHNSVSVTLPASPDLGTVIYVENSSSLTTSGDVAIPAGATWMLIWDGTQWVHPQ